LELLMQMRDAGFEVTAAAQEVDEDEVISRLGLNGGSIVEQPFKPTAKPEPEPEPSPVATIVEEPPAPEPAAEEAKPATRKRKTVGPKIIDDPDAEPAEEPAVAAVAEPEPEETPEPVAEVAVEPVAEVAVEEPVAEPEA